MWNIFHVVSVVFTIIESSQLWRIEECKQLVSSTRLEIACEYAHNLWQMTDLHPEIIINLILNIEQNKVLIQFHKQGKILLPYDIYILLTKQYALQTPELAFIISPPSDKFYAEDYNFLINSPDFLYIQRMTNDDRNALLLGLTFGDFKHVEILVPYLFKGNFQTFSLIIDNYLPELRNVSFVKTERGRLVEYSTVKRIQNTLNISLPSIRENSSSIDPITLLDGSRISIARLRNIIDDVWHPQNVNVLSKVRASDKQKTVYELTSMQLWLKVFLIIHLHKNGNFTENKHSMLHLLTNGDRKFRLGTSIEETMRNIDNSHEHLIKIDSAFVRDDGDLKTVETFHKLVPITDMKNEKNKNRELILFDITDYNTTGDSDDARITSSFRSSNTSIDERHKAINNFTAGENYEEYFVKNMRSSLIETISASPPSSESSTSSNITNFQTSSHIRKKSSKSIQNNRNADNDLIYKTTTAVAEIARETLSVSSLYVTKNDEIISTRQLHSDNGSTPTNLKEILQLSNMYTISAIDIKPIPHTGKKNEISSNYSDLQMQNFPPNSSSSRILCTASLFPVNMNTTRRCHIVAYASYLPNLSRPIPKNTATDLNSTTENELCRYEDAYNCTGDRMSTKDDNLEGKLNNLFLKREQSRMNNISMHIHDESKTSSSYAPELTVARERPSADSETDLFLGLTRRPLLDNLFSNHVGISRPRNFRQRFASTNQNYSTADVRRRKQRLHTRDFNNKISRKFSKSKAPDESPHISGISGVDSKIDLKQSSIIQGKKDKAPLRNSPIIWIKTIPSKLGH